MTDEVAYSTLKAGDVIREHDTDFRVVEVGSFMRRDVRVWTVTTEAVSKPHRVLSPFVREIGDEWVLQASGFAARTVVVSHRPEPDEPDLSEFARELGKRFLGF